ncbi:MAG: Gfo/Idh/MocA family protein, partial [Planctomycetaceae bacterium]
RAVENAEVTVISGRRRSRLETLSRKFHVPRWTQSYEEILSDPAIDAVIIALPHPLHVEWGLKALAAGKHVFVEKPLSTSLEEADRFVAAVAQTDRTVLAMPFVSTPRVLAAREMVAAGALGIVSAARCRHSHGGPEVYYAGIQQILEEQPEDALWFFDADKADVGALFDMGVYAIANLVTICGSVIKVTARLTTVAKPTRLEDTAIVLLDFESGALGVTETGWCDAARTSEFSIHGTEGKLISRSRGLDLTHYRPSSTTDEDAPQTEQPVDLSGHPQENVHQHWIACIRRGEQPPLSNARSARHITELMLAALRSSHEGRPVEIRSRVE